MIKFLKIIFFIVLFFALLIVFMPKDRLFNKLTYILKDNNIILINKDIKDEYFSLKLNNTKVLFNKIEMANIKDITINTFLVYNKLVVNDVKIDDSLNNIIPSDISKIDIKYSILDPINISIKIYSKLYKAKGTFNIFDKKLLLDMDLSKRFKTKYKKIIRQLKYDKNTKGYKYEYQL